MEQTGVLKVNLWDSFCHDCNKYFDRVSFESHHNSNDCSVVIKHEPPADPDLEEEDCSNSDKNTHGIRNKSTRSLSTSYQDEDEEREDEENGRGKTDTENEADNFSDEEYEPVKNNKQYKSLRRGAKNAKPASSTVTKSVKSKTLNTPNKPVASSVLKPIQTSALQDYLHCYKCFKTFYKLPLLTQHVQNCRAQLNSTFEQYKNKNERRKPESISIATIFPVPIDDLDENQENGSKDKILIAKSSRWTQKANLPASTTTTSCSSRTRRISSLSSQQIKDVSSLPLSNSDSNKKPKSRSKSEDNDLNQEDINEPFSPSSDSSLPFPVNNDDNDDWIPQVDLLEENQNQNPEVNSDLEDFEKTESYQASNSDINKEGEKKRFSCEQCGKKLSSREGLYRHRFVHIRDQRFKCLYCNFTASSLARFIGHLDSEHEPEPPIKCLEVSCFSTFDSFEELHLHMKQTKHPLLCATSTTATPADTSGPVSGLNLDTNLGEFQCQMCPAKYTTEKFLREHAKVHEGVFPFKCTYKNCDRAFHGQKNLRCHLRIHRREEERANIENPGNVPFIPELAYICEENGCGKIFAKARNLAWHRKTHLPKQICCPVVECSRTFATEQQLTSHNMKVHENRKDLMCHHCGARFAKPFHMKLHMRKHLGIKPEVCHICGRTFTLRAILTRHLHLHSDTRPFPCRFEGCDKRFRICTHRKRHEQTHSKVKPYSCKFCDLKFPDNRPLKKHVMSTHGDEHEFDLDVPATYQGQGQTYF